MRRVFAVVPELNICSRFLFIINVEELIITYY